MGRWRYEDFYFPPSTPRSVKGGIKAQTQRGTFGASWWAKRWIQVLEGFHIGARLRRGRSYARQGQVTSIVIDKGLITATVQGSRPRPYAVTINVKSISTRGWNKLATILSGSALYVAKLLAGTMPQDIEDAFNTAGLSLFPGRVQDLQTDCSCPDWSNPCKHIAAVYYLLGEEFDRNPFLIFKLRGITREELVGLLGDHGAKRPGRKTGGQVAGSTEERQPQAVAEPLPIDPSAFWAESLPPEDLIGEVQLPPVAASLVKRLGNVPFWRGEERFLDIVEPIYAAAAAGGLGVLLGERRTDRGGATVPPNPKPPDR